MKKILIGVTLLMAIIYAAGEFMMSPRGTWRYKMTVEIETPEGVKVGSAVREINVIHGIKITPESHPSISLKGEAVAVDLGERGMVFALLNDAESLVFKAFPIPGKIPGGGGTTPEGIRYYAQLKTGSAVLPPKWVPMMVTFTDRNDPASVELVYQSELDFQNSTPSKGTHYNITDNFESIFGNGVKLKQVKIEMTEDPVTVEVVKWLPWLPEYYGQLLDKRRFHTFEAQNKLANSLGAGSFAVNTIKRNNK